MGFKLDGSNFYETFLTLVTGSGIRGYRKFFSRSFFLLAWVTPFTKVKNVNLIIIKFIFLCIHGGKTASSLHRGPTRYP